MMSQAIFGCDLSKGRIDVHDLACGRDFHLANDADAIVGWLAELPESARVVFEATSHCDHALIAALAAAGRPIHRLNPKRVRDYARATGVLAKTDRVDARVLADMGLRTELPVMCPPDPECEALAAKTKRREQLVVMRQAEGLRLAEAQDPAIQREIRAMIRLLSARIEKLEAAIDALLSSSENLGPKAKRLRSMPGIGPVGCAVLLAELPELGTFCRRRIASMAGVAPLARDSGTMRGKRSIWGGRRQVRRILYIAALNAARCAAAFKEKYQRMRAQGKAAKTAYIAIARQILVILNAMMRDEKDFAAA